MQNEIKLSISPFEKVVNVHQLAKPGTLTHLTIEVIGFNIDSCIIQVIQKRIVVYLAFGFKTPSLRSQRRSN